MSDKYEEKKKRSFYLHDYETISKAVDAVKPITNLAIGDASITVLDSTGTYKVCELWWDVEEELWRVDMKGYGEA